MKRCRCFFLTYAIFDIAFDPNKVHELIDVVVRKQNKRRKDWLKRHLQEFLNDDFSARGTRQSDKGNLVRITELTSNSSQDLSSSEGDCFDAKELRKQLGGLQNLGLENT